MLRFQVSGPGRVIGVGNGNPTSTEPDQASERRAFNGLCQAIVQSSGTAGRVRIRADAQGLQGIAVSILAFASW